MNASEHIVESYFRLTLGFFTLADKKVPHGNGRQLDLLAVNLSDRRQCHIEVGVTHRENWAPSKTELAQGFEKKFFGAPTKRPGKSDGTTDYEKGKSYFEAILNGYREVGIDPDQVARIWVCWMIKDADNKKPIAMAFDSTHLKKHFTIQVLSLRDLVLPALEKSISTAHYDDEVVRT